MNWIWQLPQWPNFSYDSNVIADIERKYQQNCAFLLGATQYSGENADLELKLSLLTDETIKSSLIEGEVLDRDSVQYSLQTHLGLIEPGKRKIRAQEAGTAELMAEQYTTYKEKLTHEMLCSWHLSLVSYRFDLENVGNYRNSDHPMQIVSGYGNQVKIHYEAPPANILNPEMDRFIEWFNNIHFTQDNTFALIKAGLTHLYFECLHPFDDGNGRIGRVLIDKSLAISANAPSIISLSKIIEQEKMQYYKILGNNNTSLDATKWLIFFGNLVLKAQDYTKAMLNFIQAKHNIFEQYKEQLNERQIKLLNRVFKNGIDGFEGGVSVENYIKITQASRASATRDLKNLVHLGIFKRTGQLKSTRYHFIIPKRAINF